MTLMLSNPKKTNVHKIGLWRRSSLTKVNSEMNQYQTIPIITTLPHLIRSDDSLCRWQKAVVIAPPASEEAFIGTHPDCPLPDSIDFDLESHCTVTVSLPSASHSESVEHEPDLSVVKSEDGSAPVSCLHLKEVIDLCTDNEEEILILPRNPTPSKCNIGKTAELISPIRQKDHSETIIANELKDHCEQVTFINNDDSFRQNGRSEMESSNSLCEIDENSTIFSDIIKQVLPNECHQTCSHVPVDSVPVLCQSLSESAKSPTNRHLVYPDVTSRKAQRVIAKIKAWTNSEVHDWLKSHHMDKICPNLTTLDGEGLQRMALQYMHDSDSFYSGVKRRLGLSVFQTLVICRSMKELTDI